jgi:hypothetical protein
LGLAANPPVVEQALQNTRIPRENLRFRRFMRLLRAETGVFRAPYE